MPMCRNEIKDGAIFVADVHLNNKRDKFYSFLVDIKNKKIKTSQLFLMGDIFDLLVGGVSYTLKKNKKYIELINEISKEVEIFYFEGNHDFNLEGIFPKVKVYDFYKQPQLFFYKNEPIVLLHGDKVTTIDYKIYTSFIRFKPTIFILNILDLLTRGIISKAIMSFQVKKDLCKKIKNFKNIIQKRVKILTKQKHLIIEGHFHQGVNFQINGKKYINLDSFACNKSFFIVQSHQSFKEPFLKKEIYR